MYLARLSTPDLLKRNEPAQKPHIAPQLNTSTEVDESVQNEFRQPKIRHISAMLSKEPDWLIEGMVEVKSYGLIFGESGSYKSFVAMDWAFCVAAGVDWCGRKVRQGPVLYMFGEGGGGIKRRFDALGKKYGMNVNDLPIYYDDDPPAIIELDEVMARTEDIAADMPLPPILVIIDTLNTAFGGGDENNTADMTAFNQGAHRLKMSCGAAVIPVHHSGLGDKDRSRGSSALHGRLDHEYQCVKNDVHMILTCKKMKDAEFPQPIHFEFKQVEIGKHGIIPLVSGYLDHSEPEEKAGKYSEKTLDLMAILADSPNGTGVFGIASRLYGVNHTIKQDEAIKKALQRMVENDTAQRIGRGLFILKKDVEL